MNKIYRLKNQVKHYDWGSKKMLPDFLNVQNTEDKPYAELWMGTHNEAPSQVYKDSDDKLVNLKEISGELPFLFKLLAVEKPLSIQAHPNKTQAEEGFKKEEKDGININAPKRNYKDSNHKPEIICAITPITLMGGFREPDEIIKSMELFVSLDNHFTKLINELENKNISGFFRLLFNFSKTQIENICSFINNADENDTKDFISGEQWKLIKRFASIYPHDIAIFSPLYLNIITLQSGQAIFIPAGVLHAYLSGFGAELMTSSDNVLRGGLTPKHIDICELMNILVFEPFIPQIINPKTNEISFNYSTPCKEFLLTSLKTNGETILPVNSPAICIVTEGELKAAGVLFNKGESFFIPKENDPVVLSGNFSLFAASIDNTYPCESA
ncbi:MAG: mannose-6-phosphate isomerase, class I [Treponema sp.]|nr:mannose-6-phosphate isomerase, class I [Treponema sp.]